MSATFWNIRRRQAAQKSTEKSVEKPVEKPAEKPKRGKVKKDA